MDEKTREMLSFLARMILRQENNNGIPVPDMDRLKRISDGKAFEEEESEPNSPVLDLDRYKGFSVKVRGRRFLCYVSSVTQNKIRDSVSGDLGGLYETKIVLTGPYAPPIGDEKKEDIFTDVIDLLDRYTKCCTEPCPPGGCYSCEWDVPNERLVSALRLLRHRLREIYPDLTEG